MDDKDQIHADKEAIQGLGGPTKVAELLGYNKTSGGVQRVQNWMTRGIPSKVKLDRPDLFLRRFSPIISSAPDPDCLSDAELAREKAPGTRTVPDVKRELT